MRCSNESSQKEKSPQYKTLDQYHDRCPLRIYRGSIYHRTSNTDRQAQGGAAAFSGGKCTGSGCYTDGSPHRGSHRTACPADISHTGRQPHRTDRFEYLQRTCCAAGRGKQHRSGTAGSGRTHLSGIDDKDHDAFGGGRTYRKHGRYIYHDLRDHCPADRSGSFPCRL